MKVSLEWLQEYLPDIKHNILKIAELLNSIGIDTEIITTNNNNQILDIKPTPNKTHCTYVYGIARELAQVTKYNLTIPSAVDVSSNNLTSTNLKIDISLRVDQLFCLKYAYAEISNLASVNKLPDYINKRLSLNNYKSSSFISDLQHYIKLCFGYEIDLVNLEDNVYKLATKNAYYTIKQNHYSSTKSSFKKTTDPSINLLKTEKLNKHLLLIGCFQEKHDSYKTENMGYVQKSDFYIFEQVLNFLWLLLQKSGVFVTVPNIINISLPAKRTIKFHSEDLKRLIGIDITPSKIKQLLPYITSDPNNDCSMSADIPQYRSDLLIVEDVIEEFLRIWGYNNIPNTVPDSKLSYKINKTNKVHQLKQTLQILGYSEVKNIPFISLDSLLKFTTTKNDHFVKIVNPIAKDNCYLRNSLLPNLLENWQYNVNRQTNSIRIFEYGTIFSDKKESQKLAGLGYGYSQGEHWRDKFLIDFYSLKGDLDHLVGSNLEYKKTNKFKFLADEYQVEICHEGNTIGFLGSINKEIIPAVSIGSYIHSPLVFELEDSFLISPAKIESFHNFSKMPSVKRDISFTVPKSMEYQFLLSALYIEINTEPVVDINVIDIFPLDNNKKRITLRLSFQEMFRTLNDQEINNKLAKIISSVEQNSLNKIKAMR